MKTLSITAVLSLTLVFAGQARAEQYPVATVEADEQAASSEKPKRTGPRGFLGGTLGAGFSFTDKQDADDVDYDTSLIFAIRGGLLTGREHRNVFTFEVAPMSNRLTWELEATATFFASYGRRVHIGRGDNWDWVWRIGPGVGGGRDFDLLVGAQLDLLTFTYFMSEHVQVEFGMPTFRFYSEAVSDPKYSFQLLFPFGISYVF